MKEVDRERERERGGEKERVGSRNLLLKTICYRNVMEQCFHYHSDEREAF